jgi:hypothetical protein
VHRAGRWASRMHSVQAAAVNRIANRGGRRAARLGLYKSFYHALCSRHLSQAIEEDHRPRPNSSVKLTAAGFVPPLKRLGLRPASREFVARPWRCSLRCKPLGRPELRSNKSDTTLLWNDPSHDCSAEPWSRFEKADDRRGGAGG